LKLLLEDGISGDDLSKILQSDDYLSNADLVFRELCTNKFGDSHFLTWDLKPESILAVQDSIVSAAARRDSIGRELAEAKQTAEDELADYYRANELPPPQEFDYAPIFQRVNGLDKSIENRMYKDPKRGILIVKYLWGLNEIKDCQACSDLNHKDVSAFFTHALDSHFKMVRQDFLRQIEIGVKESWNYFIVHEDLVGALVAKLLKREGFGEDLLKLFIQRWNAQIEEQILSMDHFQDLWVGNTRLTEAANEIGLDKVGFSTLLRKPETSRFNKTPEDFCSWLSSQNGDQEMLAILKQSLALAKRDVER
jgi:hypothetical protein